MGSRNRCAVAVALGFLAVSCGNSESSTEIAGAASTEVPAVTTPEFEFEPSPPHDGNLFDPAKWDEVPDWWLEAQNVPFDQLVVQEARFVETLWPVEMNPGNTSFLMVVPEDWGEYCIGGDRCVFSTLGEGNESLRPANGFADDWGGEEGRTWADHPSANESSQVSIGEPFSYVEGETEPLNCEANEKKSDPEATDLYPEPWLVACVGTIDEFTIARVEMFRLNEDCQPYGNSYGAWIGWEHAHQSNIDLFVEILAVQMFADRIECVTLDTLLGIDYGIWMPSKSSLDRDSGSFFFLHRRDDLPDYHRIWVTELQRRIGAESDGIYGPKTHKLHFQTVNKLRDSESAPLGSSVPLISSGPCGTFKLDPSKWPSEDLLSKWTESDGWIPEDSALVTPLLASEPWWYTEGNEQYEEPVPPPLPDYVSTADATGDGVDDFILRFFSGNDSLGGVATIHENELGCSWRYVNERAGRRPIGVRLAETDHDYWDVSAKWGSDSQGNSCYLNMVYGRYDSETDSFEDTMCQIYWGYVPGYNEDLKSE